MELVRDINKLLTFEKGTEVELQKTINAVLGLTISI